MSPLAAYETGPLLLVCPHSDGESEDIDEREIDARSVSCDAWFLWRPEAIDSSVFVRLKGGGLEVADDDGGKSLF